VERPVRLLTRGHFISTAYLIFIVSLTYFLNFKALANERATSNDLYLRVDQRKLPASSARHLSVRRSGPGGQEALRRDLPGSEGCDR